MTTQTPERKPRPAHPQHAITLEAAQRPAFLVEALTSGVSGGMSVWLFSSQWRWLAAEKARRHGKAYRASKAQQAAA